MCREVVPRRYFRGGGSGVLSYELFFPWLVASLFVDLEMALLLAGYRIPDLPSSEYLVAAGV
jgi:hypothetical protein